MSQKYRFNKDRDPLLVDVKNLIKRLLQPEPKKRPSIDGVLAHVWFFRDTSPEGNNFVFESFLSSVMTKNWCTEVNRELKDRKIDKNSTIVDKTNEHHVNATVKRSTEDIMKTDVSLSDDALSNIRTDEPNTKVEDENATAPLIGRLRSSFRDTS